MSGNLLRFFSSKIYLGNLKIKHKSLSCIQIVSSLCTEDWPSLRCINPDNRSRVSQKLNVINMFVVRDNYIKRQPVTKKTFLEYIISSGS